EQRVTTFAPEERPAHSARFLVMDDQQLVRLVLQRALEGAGHRVSLVSKGEDALALYEDGLEAGDPFDLVFLDLFVPHGMGGSETCRRILERDPHAACIVISGNPRSEPMSDPLAHGFVGQLEKPFHLPEVDRLVAEWVSGDDESESDGSETNTGEVISGADFDEKIILHDFS
ncbi:MAG: response regulator, partial [Verrucomicrobiota bacterium]